VRKRHILLLDKGENTQISQEQFMSQTKQTEKTNVMRILDAAGVAYRSHCYASSGAVSAVDLASALSADPARVFKTLVTVGKTGNHYVFMIPAAEELNLKKAAAAVGEKAIEMIKQKELLPLTGYIHGGCSPIGMKKLFKTTIDSSASALDTFCFSGGKIGCQVEMSLDDLKKIIPLQLAEVAE